MKKLTLTLEAGTAELALLVDGEPIQTVPLPGLLELELHAGQQARINHLSGDELRVVAVNSGDEMVPAELWNGETLSERNTLVPGDLRDPGNNVVLHGWGGDWFLLGEVPVPVAVVLSVPAVTETPE